MIARSKGPAIALFLGVIVCGLAFSAGRLGFVASPGSRIGQILLAITGVVCAVAGLVNLSAPLRRVVLGILRSQFSLVLGSTLAGLLLCELAALAIEAVGQRGKQAQGEQTRNEMKYVVQPVADPQLELRLPPLAGGHDAKGFRNDRVPETASIVAIGDSQTWGINASRSEAWPQVLARLSSRSVYNMGLGSYGTVHYWVLTDEALKLAPKTIVIGLFLGNDLWDAYRMAYSLGLHPQFRAENVDAALLTDSVEKRYHETVKEAEAFRARMAQPATASRWYDSLRAHSAFARVFYQRGLWPAEGRREYEDYERNVLWAKAFPEKGVVYDRGDIRTVFATSQHMLGVDLDEPRIAAGLQVTKKVLLALQAKTASAKVNFLVLLIPVKEAAYAKLFKDAGIANATFDQVVAQAARAQAELMSFCNRNGIKFVDPLPQLKGALARQEQIYPWTADSHFLPRGYALLANAVHQELAKLNW